MTSTVSARILGTSLAIFVSLTPALSICYGLFGRQGNSVITGSLMAILLIVIFLSSIRNFRAFTPGDLLFVGLVLVATASTIVNHGPAALSEFLLFASALVAYIACRSLSAASIYALLPSFKRTTAIIILIGSAITVATMIVSNQLGRPAVLGLAGIPTQLLTSTGFLTLALVSSDDPTPRRTALISIAVFATSVIFAAATVRFSFGAFLCALVIAAATIEKGKRKHVAAVIACIVIGILVGLSANTRTTKLYVELTTEAAVGERTGPVVKSEAGSSVPCAAVNLNNSIEIRRYLLKEAVSRIPSAGLVGTGLDSFMLSSCIDNHQVHNSVLQAIVELGWLGGAFFVALFGFTAIAILPAAMQCSSARFVLCSLVFAFLLTLAHGRISRDTQLFVFAGCAAGISSGAASRRRVEI